MAMIDKVNGKIRVNCIIMTRGVIPNFAGVMGPILQPRPIELNEVLLLLKMGVDLRAVDRNKKFKLNEAVKLNESVVRQIVDEFENGKRPVHQPKQQRPVQQPQPVVENKPKEVKVEQKVEEPVVKQQPQQNKNNKNNKNKK